MPSSFLQGGPSFRFEQVPASSPFIINYLCPILTYLTVSSHMLLLSSLSYSAFQPTKDKAAGKLDHSVHDSVAYNMVSNTVRHTSSFLGKLFQNIGNLNKSRKGGRAFDSEEGGVGAGVNNIMAWRPPKPEEDQNVEGELVVMVTDLGAGTHFPTANSYTLFQH